MKLFTEISLIWLSYDYICVINMILIWRKFHMWIICILFHMIHIWVFIWSATYDTHIIQYAYDTHIIILGFSYERQYIWESYVAKLLMHMVSFWNELVGSRNVNISFTFVQPQDGQKITFRKTNVSVWLVVCNMYFGIPP